MGCPSSCCNCLAEVLFPDPEFPRSTINMAKNLVQSPHSQIYRIRR
ncbi:hypothetical protein FM114_02980 [Luteococcus japonicus LSP_Lj1]|uniref:Uncharacterized protein n=1 Tax=Luteococcus japonicus LSP_Lj1 TaxID=1255658 RepID=A0A1R4IQC9_9ACTN|nr:hypothetical protein FM114_02980 [Luteococcus japonicus LSP_Lj1]